MGLPTGVPVPLSGVTGPILPRRRRHHPAATAAASTTTRTAAAAAEIARRISPLGSARLSSSVTPAFFIISFFSSSDWRCISCALSSAEHLGHPRRHIEALAPGFARCLAFRRRSPGTGHFARRRPWRRSRRGLPRGRSRGRRLRGLVLRPVAKRGLAQSSRTRSASLPPSSAKSGSSPRCSPSFAPALDLDELLVREAQLDRRLHEPAVESSWSRGPCRRTRAPPSPAR